MKLEATFCGLPIPDPLVGESLSSWMYRVRTTHPIFVPSQHEKLDDPPLLPPRHDVDFFTDNFEATKFARSYGLRMSLLRETFKRPSETLIPIKYRCAYCYTCVAEAIKATGLPICYTRWRHVMEPFCSIHGVLLREVSWQESLAADYPRQVFKSFHAPVRHDHYGAISASQKRALELSFGVQVKISQWVKSCLDPLVKDKVASFFLTLLRMAISHSIRSTYIDNMMPGAGKIDLAYRYNSFYTNCYLRPLCVSSEARARCFNLIGTLMGWIDYEHNVEVQHRYTYMVARPENIWGTVEKNHILYVWLKSQLSMFATEQLSQKNLIAFPASWC